MKKSILSISLLFFIVGCSEQVADTSKAAEVKEPKTPNTIDATNFCKMGSIISDYSAETATSFATDFIKQENIKESYIYTYGMGLLEGQMAVATGNFNSSLQDFSYGTNDYSKQNNADLSGPFVTGCVKYIIK
tara:strand:+ start:27 stop:425 length:399 start_codon:yes stop_codon:yes gene_type:complete